MTMHVGNSLNGARPVDRRILSAFRMLLLCSVLLLPGAGIAGPDPCTDAVNGQLCSGNQTDGIWLKFEPIGIDIQPHISFNTPIHATAVITVENLTQYIAPLAGIEGIFVTRSRNQTIFGERTQDPLSLIVNGSTLGPGVGVGLGGGISVGGGGGSNDLPVRIDTQDASAIAVVMNAEADKHGGDIAILLNGPLEVFASGAGAHGVFAQSTGGRGINGSSNAGSGGDGNMGDPGGNVSVINNATIKVDGFGAQGILAQSFAGNGGRGGSGAFGSGGDGGPGGTNTGITVSVTNNGSINARGGNSSAIAAQNNGGNGGRAGNGGVWSGGLTGGGGNGGDAGHGGDVFGINTGQLITGADSSHGIFLQSVGGFGGAGASAIGILSWAGDGGSAGQGGTVNASNTGHILTTRDYSKGIFAQSVGGGGGAGGNANGLIALGGLGSFGGNGNTVDVSNAGTIETLGRQSHAIFAQSIGGNGGDGGDSGGLIAIGGTGGGAGEGGTVTVSNSGVLSTTGENAHALFAQTVGGGGGTGGFSGGIASLGGSGGGGGNGGQAIARLQAAATFSTLGNDSVGIFAQSVGGGGGDGGSAIGAGPFVSFSMGGSGGSGGNGGDVSVLDCTPAVLFGQTLCVASVGPSGSIITAGARSHGIQAQSIGGGGGNGGVFDVAFGWRRGECRHRHWWIGRQWRHCRRGLRRCRSRCRHARLWRTRDYRGKYRRRRRHRRICRCIVSG